MIDYTRYDKYRGLWAAQATDTETCPGTVGEHYRSSDEALADIVGSQRSITAAIDTMRT